MLRSNNCTKWSLQGVTPSKPVCNACAMHSQPALVEYTFRKSDVAPFTAALNCWAMVPDVRAPFGGEVGGGYL